MIPISGKTELALVTEDTLDRMQEVGWFLGDDRQRRFDRPCEWDINCGWCREWAELAQARVGGEVVWLDQLGYDPDETCHAVLLLDGRFFDAQHPAGVEDARDLDVVRCVSREVFIERGADRRGERASVSVALPVPACV